MSAETLTHALNVPDEWACEELGQLVDASRGISYGVVQPGQDDEDGIPILRVNNLKNGRIHTSDILHVSKNIEAKYERTRLRGGEILLSLVGTLGECAVVPAELCGWNVARAVSVIPLKSGIDPRWITYCLRSSEVQGLMRAWATTTVQATLNLRDVRRLPILLPPEPLRSAMTDAVGFIDDKIEHNRRTAQALERLARAIFRAWFVDFEPVKAKAAGATAFPSMPQAVFDALPTRFIDSEIGPVPEGWAVGALGDILRERKERIVRSEETLRLPYVPIECITARQVTLEEWKDGREANSSLIRFVAGDILFGAMRAYFHKVCLAPFGGTTRTTCFVLNPKAEKDRAFSLMLASETSTVEYATNHSIGSTIPYAKWENSLASMPCIIPPESLRAAFADLVDDQLWYCQQLVRESAKLRKMRDYLLPKLLSGEVRVNNVKQPAGEIL